MDAQNQTTADEAVGLLERKKSLLGFWRFSEASGSHVTCRLRQG